MGSGEHLCYRSQEGLEWLPLFLIAPFPKVSVPPLIFLCSGAFNLETPSCHLLSKAPVTKPYISGTCDFSCCSWALGRPGCKNDSQKHRFKGGCPRATSRCLLPRAKPEFAGDGTYGCFRECVLLECVLPGDANCGERHWACLQGFLCRQPHIHSVRQVLRLCQCRVRKLMYLAQGLGFESRKSVFRACASSYHGSQSLLPKPQDCLLT